MPTLLAARRLAAWTDLGTTADSISWWEPGVLVADGVSLWGQVVALKFPESETLEEAA